MAMGNGAFLFAQEKSVACRKIGHRRLQGGFGSAWVDMVMCRVEQRGLHGLRLDTPRQSLSLRHPELDSVRQNGFHEGFERANTSHISDFEAVVREAAEFDHR